MLSVAVFVFNEIYDKRSLEKKEKLELTVQDFDIDRIVWPMMDIVRW